jgi:hypothetical protein
MSAFVRRCADLVWGALSGFDRLVFRGTLRNLSYPLGLQHYRWANQVPFQDFDRHSRQVTQQLVDASLRLAQATGREIKYLNSTQISKEDEARAIAARDGISEGLIGVLRAVEPCRSFQINKNRARQRLEIHYRQRQCLHLYHYQIHPVFGFRHARIQTWFPFRVYVCLNGREWLARQMDQAGLAYQRRDNCFPWLEDVARAQALMDAQLRAAWPELLQAIVRVLHPAPDQIFARYPAQYYWSVHQSEWASDVMFRSRSDLEAVYPRLVRHALTTYGAGDVLRFLGRRIGRTGKVPAPFAGAVASDAAERPEGVRLKHRLNDNSVKMYDKGSILRVETTINQPGDFRVYRAKENAPDGPKAWLELRAGIADLHRRAEVSQAANERYQQALAAVREATPLRQWAEPLCRPATEPSRRTEGGGRKPARRVRALNPLGAADAALLAAVARPEFVVNGLRNRDLSRLLLGKPTKDRADQRRRSAAITRKLRLLRAHGLLQKVPKTHRYQVSSDGRQAITALLAARDASTDQLTANVA